MILMTCYFEIHLSCVQFSDENYSENQIRTTIATTKVEVEVHTHTKGIHSKTQLARLSEHTVLTEHNLKDGSAKLQTGLFEKSSVAK